MPFFDKWYIFICNSSGGSSGSNLDTDNNGSVSGTFTIPDPKDNSNPRWRTGERVFRLTSNQNDDRTRCRNFSRIRLCC